MPTTANLARRVGTEAEPAIHPGHRRGVDDVAAFAVGADVRQEGADAVQHAHQIDVEHPAPVVERDVVDAAGGRNAGIVADHMDVAEGLDCLLGRAIDAWRDRRRRRTRRARPARHCAGSLTAALSASVSISASITFMPASAKARPSAKPMPPAPPVTNAVLPASSRMMFPLIEVNRDAIAGAAVRSIRGG